MAGVVKNNKVVNNDKKKDPPKPIQRPSEELSIIIKSFNRPKSLDACLKSINVHLPKIPVIVLDDSTVDIKPHPLASTWIKVKEWIGLNEGRNRLVDYCYTPYCALIEDDYVLTKASRLSVLLEAVKRGQDIAGGQLVDMPGRSYRTQARSYVYKNGVLSTFLGYKPTDRLPWKDITAYKVSYVGNFFVAKTNLLRKVKWDPEVEIGSSHPDFFINFFLNHGGKVCYIPEVVTQHWPNKQDPEYRKFRRRNNPQILRDKYNIKKIELTKIKGVTWKP